jgi:hypothetical protein
MTFQRIVPRSLYVTILLGLVASLATVPVHAASTPPTLTVTSTTKHAVGTDPTVIAPTLTIADDDNEVLDGAQASLTNNFTSDTDRLGISGQGTAMSGTVNGLTWGYNLTTGILTFSGVAPVTTYQAALQQVTFYTIGTPALQPRMVQFTLGSALAHPANGHFYRFIAESGIPWNSARDAAMDSTLFGVRGYLVTITSEAENSFIHDKIGRDTWIGASDAVMEGDWRWMTGPEAGTQFWSGTYATGSPVNNQYNHWRHEQPDDKNNEDYGHIFAYPWSGFWNDLPQPYPSGYHMTTGYIVEYGGMPGDPVLHITGTATVNVVQKFIYLPIVNASGSPAASVMR